MKSSVLAFVATSAALVAPAMSSAQPTGAPAGGATMGSKLFLQCRACHTVGVSEADGVGPNLSGVVGAKAGSRSTYAYSPAMAKSGLTWTPTTLDRFLTKPSALVPGTRMAFAGVASPKSRADLIDYLTTLKATRR